MHFNAPGDFEVINPDFAFIRTEEYALFKTARNRRMGEGVRPRGDRHARAARRTPRQGRLTPRGSRHSSTGFAGRLHPCPGVARRARMRRASGRGFLCNRRSSSTPIPARTTPSRSCSRSPRRRSSTSSASSPSPAMSALAQNARNALKVVELSGRTDVPVYAGCERPMRRKLVTAEHVHGETGLDGPDLPEPKIKLQPQHGVDFLIDTLSRRRARDRSRSARSGRSPMSRMALVKAPDIAPRITRDRHDGRRPISRSATSRRRPSSTSMSIRRRPTSCSGAASRSP